MVFFIDENTNEWITIPGYLDELEVGDCLTYEWRNTYYCIDRDDRVLTLKKCYTGNFGKLSAKTFEKAEIIKVNMVDDKDVQSIFRDNLICHMRGIFVAKMTKAAFIEQYIANIDAEIKAGESKELKWGLMKVLVKKSLIDNTLSWYIDGKIMSEDIIKNMIGCFKNAPQEFCFIRKKPTEDKRLLDEFCFCELMDLYRGIDYPNMFLMIDNYVIENSEDLTVEVNTFVPDENSNYLAQKFSFVYEDGDSKIYQFPQNEEIDFCDLIGVYIKCNEENTNYRF